MYVAYVYAHVHEKRCKSTKINRYEQNFKEKSVEKIFFCKNLHIKGFELLTPPVKKESFLALHPP